MEYFPGLTTLQILKEIQDKLEAHQTSPEEFEDGLVFMSTVNDIDWTKNGNSYECFSNSDKVKDFAKKKIRWDIGLLRVKEKKKNGMERTITNLKDSEIQLLKTANFVVRTGSTIVFKGKRDGYVKN